jgi:hypothetical protein
MSSDESSDNEAPQEISFAEAKQAGDYRLRNAVQQRKKQPKKNKPEARVTKKQIDADVLAALESGLGAEADQQLQSRKEKMDRTERATQMININPAMHQVEQKIDHNLKVVCLKKIPVIPKSDKFKEMRNGILQRGSLNRRPLKLSK